MKATLTRYKIDNLLDETGDDITFLHLFIKVENLPEMIMPIMLPYEHFVDFVKNYDEPLHKYLKKIRSSIAGYGPKHSKVFEILNNEGFDFTFHLNKYIYSKDEVFLQQHINYCKNLNKPENQENVERIVKKFEGFFDDGYRKSNIKINNFTDDLDQTIHELTLKYFPELFEMSEKHIAEYRKELFYTVTGFREKIDKILHNIL